MRFAELPPVASWCHDSSRAGFEAVSLRRSGAGWTATGSTTAVEDGAAWVVAYVLELDADGSTRSADVTAGGRTLALRRDDTGWTVDGDRRPDLDGCLDVDLESSALTNAFPMRRLALEVGATAEAPAAFVRVSGEVERLEQRYVRLPGEPLVVDYAAPAFDFTARISYDDAGLVLDYPGIGHRDDRPCGSR